MQTFFSSYTLLEMPDIDRTLKINFKDAKRLQKLNSDKELSKQTTQILFESIKPGNLTIHGNSSFRLATARIVLTGTNAIHAGALSVTCGVANAAHRMFKHSTLTIEDYSKKELIYALMNRALRMLSFVDNQLISFFISNPKELTNLSILSLIYQSKDSDAATLMLLNGQILSSDDLNMLGKNTKDIFYQIIALCGFLKGNFADDWATLLLNIEISQQDLNNAEQEKYRQLWYLTKKISEKLHDNAFFTEVLNEYNISVRLESLIHSNPKNARKV